MGSANPSPGLLVAAALLVLACASAGCQRAAEPAPPPPKAAPSKGTSRAEATRAGDRIELTGILRTSKGFGTVGDVLIRPRDMEAAAGKGWRRLVGQRVHVSGVRHDVRCGPHEQCLIGGTLPLLENVELTPVQAPGLHR